MQWDASVLEEVRQARTGVITVLLALMLEDCVWAIFTFCIPFLFAYYSFFFSS